MLSLPFTSSRLNTSQPPVPVCHLDKDVLGCDSFCAMSVPGAWASSLPEPAPGSWLLVGRTWFCVAFLILTTGSPTPLPYSPVLKPTWAFLPDPYPALNEGTGRVPGQTTRWLWLVSVPVLHLWALGGGSRCQGPAFPQALDFVLTIFLIFLLIVFIYFIWTSEQRHGHGI